MKPYLAVLALASIILLIGCTGPTPPANNNTNQTAPPACLALENYNTAANQCEPDTAELRKVIQAFYESSEDVIKETTTTTMTTVYNGTRETTDKQTSVSSAKVDWEKRKAETSTGGATSYIINETVYEEAEEGWTKYNYEAFWEQMEQTDELESEMFERSPLTFKQKTMIDGLQTFGVIITPSEDDAQYYLESAILAMVPAFSSMGEGYETKLSMEPMEYYITESGKIKMISGKVYMDITYLETKIMSMVIELKQKYDFRTVIVTLPAETMYAKTVPTPGETEKVYCNSINPKDAAVRSAATYAVIHEGSYSIDQILDIWDYVKDNVMYVNDPNRQITENLPYAPAETLANGAGDCEDQAVLIAAMVEAIGGDAQVRVNYECGHAYAAVYVGDDYDLDYVLDIVGYRYPSSKRMYMIDDNYEYWLILDPAGGWYPGDLLTSCYMQQEDQYGGFTWREEGESYSFVSCVR